MGYELYGLDLDPSQRDQVRVQVPELLSIAHAKVRFDVGAQEFPLVTARTKSYEYLTVVFFATTSSSIIHHHSSS